VQKRSFELLCLRFNWYVGEFANVTTESENLFSGGCAISCTPTVKHTAPYDRLLAIARRDGRVRDDAEDLVQTACLAALTSGRRDFGDARVMAWLAGRNQAPSHSVQSAG
jgi:hypothetical protein